MSRTYPFLMQNIILPLYDIAKGTSRFRFGRSLRKSQWLSLEQVEELQSRNLRALLRHAYGTVPYYRRVFRERRLTPTDVRCVSDLEKLPVLTKDDVRKNAGELVSRSFPKPDLVPYRSGGSGDRINFYITKEQLSWEVAAEYRAYGWAGYRLGDRCFMFWGSPLDLSRYEGMIKRIANTLERTLVAYTYVMSDEALDRLASMLVRYKPDIIRGYATSVYMMAKYLLEKGIDQVRPRAVITSAETMFDFRRKTIEEAFGCPVFDLYGSREIGAMAAECEEHYGHHISAENVALEFIRDGQKVAPGENGSIIVTSLKNFGMPFIRYEIGDVGRPSSETCTCGRGLPLMASIEGRVSDFVAIYDKHLKRIVPVGPVYPIVIHALLHFPLKSCRMIQENLDHVLLKAVRDKGYEKKHTDALVSYIHKYLGESIQVDVEFVDSIEPLPSGKRPVFISRIDAFKQSI